MMTAENVTADLNAIARVFDIDKAAQAYAERKIESEFAYHRKSDPAKLEKHLREHPDQVERWKAGELSAARALVIELLDKLACYKAHKRGRFHPSNPNSRRLFQDLTGLKLPPTVSGTDQAVREYVGNEAIDAEDERIAKDRRDGLERDAAIKKMACDKRISAISAKVAGQEVHNLPAGAIDGDELIDLARHLGIEMHPRTVGMIRKRLSWINSNQAGCRGKGPIQNAFVVYRACFKILTETSANV